MANKQTIGTWEITCKSHIMGDLFFKPAYEIIIHNASKENNWNNTIVILETCVLGRVSQPVWSWGSGSSFHSDNMVALDPVWSKGYGGLKHGAKRWWPYSLYTQSNCDTYLQTVEIKIPTRSNDQLLPQTQKAQSFLRLALPKTALNCKCLLKSPLPNYRCRKKRRRRSKKCEQ